MERTDRPMLGWPTTFLLLVGVHAAAVVSVVLSPAASPVATFWPAAGLAVALVVLSPRRRWPLLWLGVAVASGAAELAGDRDLVVAALSGAGGATGAVLAGSVLRRAPGRPRLEGHDDLVRLVVAAATGAAVAGTVLAAAPALGPAGGRPLATFWLVLGSHGASVLVLAPLALTGAGARRTGRGAELALQSGLLVLATLVTFAPGQELPVTSLPLLFLVWAALRFDLRAVAAQLAAFGLVVSLVTARGHGPFADTVAAGAADVLVAGALSQGYLVTAALISLPLGVAVQQRAALLRRVSADERLFRRNFTESLAGMLFLSSRGDRLRVVDLNAAAVEVLGGDRDRLVGQPIDEVLLHDRLTEAAERLADGRADGWRGQAGLGPLTGREGRVNVALSLLSGGPSPVFSAQLLDVSAEYEARRRLESAEKLTSATLDTAACIILLTDLDGRIVRVNAATTEITGYPAEELVGRPVWETPLAASSSADLQALLLWPNRSGAPAVREVEGVTRAGEPLQVVWNSNVVRDELGFPAYAVMTGVDVTAERASAGLVTHLMRASITTALIGLDPRGRITVANSGARRLLGAEEHELVGRPFAGFLDREQLLSRTGADDPDRALAALLADVAASEEGRARDWTWVSGTGSRRIVSMSLSAVAEASALDVGFLCVGRDVTEQRHGQELLVAALEKERDAVERLRALDQAKGEFVSTVSHELRTPVTSIVGYTEMLADGSVVEPAPEQLPMLESIARNGQRLIALCNDLLALSGLDSGSTQWERQAVDLVAVLAAAEDSLRPLLAGRRLEVSFTAPPGPVRVTGDPDQLERALSNLLGNAVKFTPDGGSVRCRLDVDGSHALLRVRDTGIGIPAEEQPELFTRFFRSSTAQKLAIQGTGLGLSIVAAIVHAHQGAVEVDSTPGEGTEFTVRLPLLRG